MFPQTFHSDGTGRRRQSSVVSVRILASRRGDRTTKTHCGCFPIAAFGVQVYIHECRIYPAYSEGDGRVCSNVRQCHIGTGWMDGYWGTPWRFDTHHHVFALLLGPCNNADTRLRLVLQTWEGRVLGRGRERGREREGVVSTRQSETGVGAECRHRSKVQTQV